MNFFEHQAAARCAGRPLAKQVISAAVTAAVGRDGRASIAQAEPLRTIRGVLHCPLPSMPERA